MTESWTFHGGHLAAAKRMFGDRGEPWIDLSTGINPHPWPGAADMAIDWQRLPEPGDLAALEAAAAAYFGVDPRFVCAVPGTEVGLRLAGRLIGGAAHHIAPGYRTHAAMIDASTAIGWDALADRRGTIIVANPSNPDGRVSDPAALRALLNRRGGGWLLVDEAFADFEPALSIASSIGDARRLIVFRSFGKFFGLAGVRLGFVLGPRGFLDDLRSLLGAWPLSAAAIKIGAAAYVDGDWITAARRRLPVQAAALDALLAEAGHVATGDCPLFRLIRTGDAHDLFDRLAKRAILTRPFAEEPQWLRIGLSAQNTSLARLKAALADG